VLAVGGRTHNTPYLPATISIAACPMPPRAKRIKVTPAIDSSTSMAPSLPHPPAVYHYAAASPANVPKVATLPTELYDQIITQLDSLPECIDYRTNGTFAELSAHEFQDRNEALRALSNASRATRAIFHSRLWERLDCVFTPRQRKIQWYKYVVTSAIKKLRGVRDDPALCEYIR